MAWYGAASHQTRTEAASAAASTAGWRWWEEAGRWPEAVCRSRQDLLAIFAASALDRRTSKMAIYHPQHPLPVRRQQGTLEDILCASRHRIDAHHVPLLQWLLGWHGRRLLVRYVTCDLYIASRLTSEQDRPSGMMSCESTKSVPSMS